MKVRHFLEVNELKQTRNTAKFYVKLKPFKKRQTHLNQRNFHYVAYSRNSTSQTTDFDELCAERKTRIKSRVRVKKGEEMNYFSERKNAQIEGNVLLNRLHAK